MLDDLGGRLGDALRRRPDVRFQAGALVGDLAGVARIADEDGAVAGEDDGAAVAGEAGEIGDVDGVADEQGVHALLGQQTRQSFAALGGVVHATLSPSGMRVKVWN